MLFFVFRRIHPHVSLECLIEITVVIEPHLLCGLVDGHISGEIVGCLGYAFFHNIIGERIIRHLLKNPADVIFTVTHFLGQYTQRQILTQMVVDIVHQFGYHGHMPGIRIIKMDAVIAVAEQVGGQLMDQRLFKDILAMGRLLVPVLFQNPQIFVKAFSFHMENWIIPAVLAEDIQKV